MNGDWDTARRKAEQLQQATAKLEGLKRQQEEGEARIRASASCWQHCTACRCPALDTLWPC